MLIECTGIFSLVKTSRHNGQFAMRAMQDPWMHMPIEVRP